MLRLLLLFTITFCTMVVFCCLLIYSRSRTVRRNHFTGGGCHDTGSSGCCSCAQSASRDSKLSHLPMYRSEGI